MFLLTVFGLLVGAGIKGKMVTAGIDLNAPWSNGRKWWEVRWLLLQITRFAKPSFTPGMDTKNELRRGQAG